MGTEGGATESLPWYCLSLCKRHWSCVDCAPRSNGGTAQTGSQEPALTFQKFTIWKGRQAEEPLGCIVTSAIRVFHRGLWKEWERALKFACEERGREVRKTLSRRQREQVLRAEVSQTSMERWKLGEKVGERGPGGSRAHSERSAARPGWSEGRVWERPDLQPEDLYPPRCWDAIKGTHSCLMTETPVPESGTSAALMAKQLKHLTDGWKLQNLLCVGSAPPWSPSGLGSVEAVVLNPLVLSLGD